MAGLKPILQIKSFKSVEEIRGYTKQTKIEIEQAERQYDLNRAAELRYGRLAELERQLQAEEEQLTRREGQSRLIKEEVDEEDIAEVVSRWTGIPVSKLLEGEIQKLLHLDEELHKRVIGQDEAVKAVAEAVRRRPYCVILFDEIEKAHFDVFNLMLQILDDGRLTDGHGRTVDFKNTIVIMTSNIGSHRILEYRGAFEGEAYERMKQAVLEEMRRHFRPEFLNRVDEIIVFHALSEEHLKQIVEIQLGYLRKRLAERHIQIELTDAAREYLVRTGYDPTYGARPLKRAIQKEVETPLARLILKGEVRDGQLVGVDYDPSRRELQFNYQGETVFAAS
jgi:ATP-dependent Clp protease ATP-binding subunit ClpA